MKKIRFSIKDIVLTAVFSAVLAALSQVAFPLPFGVSLTLQTFAAALCGYCLSAFLGVISVLVYIALGAVGVPVFSSFRSGAGVLAGPSGGFIFGFILLALFCGIAIKKSRSLAAVLSLAGLILCHLFGVVQFSLVTHTPLVSTFLSISLPFLLKDAVSVFLAYLIALKLRKIIIKK